MTLFYLGTHDVSWLGKTDVPLFLSARRMRLRKSWPKALGPWALDSGGFSELGLFGKWETSPEQYVAEVRRWRDACGGLQFAAIQDWMVEEVMLKKTGLSVAEHQRRTVDSLLRLRDMAPEIPWAPVIQGWVARDYRTCIELYEKAGVDLSKEPIVGIGSVCRRQATNWAARIVADLTVDYGVKLHGFGFKTAGLPDVWGALSSADSLAWSFNAKNNPSRMSCPDARKHCGNCMHFALEWREDMLVKVQREAAEGYSYFKMLNRDTEVAHA